MTISILHGDCLDILRGLPEQSVHCCITSPPYWGLRDYGASGQVGREETPEAYVETLVAVFREVHRVLRDDATLWLNLGDSYMGSGKGYGDIGSPGKQNSNKGTLENRKVKPPGLAKHPTIKPKDLVGIPWMVAFALRDDGWYLRSEVIWHKPNAMPESVDDRPTTAHERIFLLSKKPKYYYDHLAIKEDALEGDGRAPGIVRDRLLDYDSKMRVLRPSKKRGEFFGKTQALPGREAFRAVVEKRNKRTVWEVAFQPFTGAHFAAYPPKLIEPCVLAGCPQGGTILDPFFGAGTTGLVADRHQLHCIGIEINAEYIEIARNRLAQEGGMFMDIRHTPPNKDSENGQQTGADSIGAAQPPGDAGNSAGQSSPQS
jgi:DNA modification methylase